MGGEGLRKTDAERVGEDESKPEARQDGEERQLGNEWRSNSSIKSYEFHGRMEDVRGGRLRLASRVTFRLFGM